MTNLETWSYIRGKHPRYEKRPILFGVVSAVVNVGKHKYLRYEVGAAY